jgi:predicted membrane-bound dolichyl-phosphate-mannose-protein mannosyltransferase
MCTVASAMVSAIGRIRTSARAPLVALVLISVLSLGARSLLLDEPCQSPCTTASDHTLIFDEAYYVNAARVIAGIRPAAGAHYADAPLGTDPNAEHPQGAKLIMAAAIEIFGDGPFAWRIGSLLMGSIAILGMFALVRSAGGGRWSAAGAAALMACDNLLLVHSRIGTLDIYALAPMIWGVALYLRGRPVAAGVVLAIATCFKEIAPYALFVLALVELGRLWAARGDPEAPADWRAWPAVKRLTSTTFVNAGVFVGLLALMDQIAPPYADAEAKLITGGPFSEIAHIITYASNLTSPHGPTGIASYPWQWLLDLKPIVYLRINPSLPGHGLNAIHPVTAFIGVISPPIMVLGIPALGFAAWRFLRRRLPGSGQSPADRQVAILAVAWFLGTWVPYALQALLDQRTSYLYYMVVVMPGIYVAAIYAAALGWRRRRVWLSGLIAVWGVSVVVAAVLLYPFVSAF